MIQKQLYCNSYFGLNHMNIIENSAGPHHLDPLKQDDLDIHCFLNKIFCLFGLVLYVPDNSYGHVGTISSHNHTFFPGQA